MSKTITITQSGVGRSISVANGVGPAGPAGSAGDFDTTIIDGSTNAVAGGAVFDALALTVKLAGAQTVTGVKTFGTGSALIIGSGITQAFLGGSFLTMDNGSTLDFDTGVSFNYGTGTAATHRTALGLGTAAIVDATATPTASKVALFDASGNLTASTTLQTSEGAEFSAGSLTMIGDGGTATIIPGTLTANRSYTQPDANGTIALTSSATGVPDTLSGTIIAYSETVVALGTVVSSATLAITAGTVITATLTASTPCAFTMPTAAAGKSFILHLKQASTPTTATFTSVIWSDGATYAATSTANRVDVISFVTTPNAAGNGWLWVGSVLPNITLP